MANKRLTIIPSVPVWMDQDTLVFDRKFYDGILMYLAVWGGRVRCLCQRAPGPAPDHDVVRKAARELPFAFTLLHGGQAVQATHLQDADIVMASADAHDQLHISALCNQLGIACVYVIEYIPETRYQIVALEAQSRLRRWRQNLFVWRTERRRKQAFALADGLQCNGVAAFAHYRSAKNPLLYFDTRTPRSSLIAAPALDERLAHVAAGHPLRLAFSGRLIGMKGADHLIDVACALRQRGLPFHLTIYGAGELAAQMRQDLVRLQLQSQVSMPGSVDFETRLLPEIRAQVDLYLMLHRQSDPSCTYLETLACGIPIVGYDNRAFTGILERADVGLSVPMDDVQGVATAIERLHAQRGLLARQSRNAAAYASQHAFEDTFGARVAHLCQVLQAHQTPALA